MSHTKLCTWGLGIELGSSGSWDNHFTYWAISLSFLLFWWIEETHIHRSKAICSSLCVGEFSRNDLSPEALISTLTTGFYPTRTHVPLSIGLQMSDWVKKQECLNVTEELWEVERVLSECVRTEESSKWMYKDRRKIWMSISCRHECDYVKDTEEHHRLPRASLENNGSCAHFDCVCRNVNQCRPPGFLQPGTASRWTQLWLAKFDFLFNCVQ